MSLDAIVGALGLFLEPDRIMWVVFGVLVGLTIGLLPGLSGLTGMALLLPFVYGMDPVSGIAMLIGMSAVTNTSDTFPAVLLGIPGTASGQATIMDGNPMAKQGQAARALGAAFFSSMVGGVLGAVFLLLSLYFARPIVLSLASPQLFMLTMLGMVFVGALVRGAPLRGLAAGVFGMLLGTIGIATAAVEYRYTFGSLYLSDGIPIAVLALGLFGIPELVDLLGSRRSIANTKLKGSQWDGIKDVLRNKWLVVRSSAVGSFLGFLPGLGGTAVNWMVYGMTVKTSRKPSNFGRGDVRGVIGPEAANNSQDGGSLVPTLLFGIPGSGTMAVLLSGLVLLGVQPGPSMVSQHLDITLVIVWTLVFANILGTLICIGLAGRIARLTAAPTSILVPFLLVLLVMAAFQSTRQWGDVYVFGLLGVLGWLMKRFRWPRPPLLVGYVLAEPAERYLHISTSRYGMDWLTDPIVLGIGAVIAAVVLSSAASAVRQRVQGRKAQELDEEHA